MLSRGENQEVDFLDFINGKKIIIHNASFDLSFLKAKTHDKNDFCLSYPAANVEG